MDKKIIFTAGLVLVAGPVLAASCLIDPVKINPNVVTSVFGKSRDLQNTGTPKTHWGTDFQARIAPGSSRGAPVLAVDDGTVIGAGFWGSGYGNRIALRRDNGDIVTYNHLASVDPALKGAGFKGSDKLATGETRVPVGTALGVAGGTSNEPGANGLAVHLHLEYVTGYSGERLRETNDRTFATRSRYLRNPTSYMCRTVPHAPGAGKETQGTGGEPPEQAQVIETARTSPSVTDRERWGIPDVPPYQTYDGMSESQIVEAEMLRRSLDTEWEQKLTEWGTRGLWMEIARIRGVKLWMETRIAEKKSRIEAMLSTHLAFQTNQYLQPKVEQAYSKAQRAIALNKID